MITWTKEETAFLKDNYNKLPNDELFSKIPNKTPLAIYKKAYKMGMRKAKDIEFINRSKAKKGEKGSNWKGGISFTSKGYKLVSCPNHHRANARGYVMEHILVFEEKTGVKVPTNCCVHHLNGNKRDNRIENLCLMSHAAHTAFHKNAKKENKP